MSGQNTVLVMGFPKFRTDPWSSALCFKISDSFIFVQGLTLDMGIYLTFILSIFFLKDG